MHQAGSNMINLRIPHQSAAVALESALTGLEVDDLMRAVSAPEC
jgi:hypothetical protein